MTAMIDGIHNEGTEYGLIGFWSLTGVTGYMKRIHVWSDACYGLPVNEGRSLAGRIVVSIWG